MTVPGYRQFECYHCGHKWSLPTRDWMSPSGEDCPECGEFIHPSGGHADSTLPTDSSGNLK